MSTAIDVYYDWFDRNIGKLWMPKTKTCHIILAGVKQAKRGWHCKEL